MIPWELQHRRAVIDVDIKVVKKIVRKEQILRRCGSGMKTKQE